MFVYFSVLSLGILLTIIKAGTLAYVSLAWSALVLLVLLAVQWNKSLIFIQDIKKECFTQRYSAFYLLALFQLWQLMQLLFQTSKNTQATQDSLILGLGFLAFLLLLSTQRWEQAKKKLLIYSIFSFGACQALYGLWIFLTQTNRILWMEKVFYLDKPTGTFVNANHFCAYLALILVLLVSYGACRLNFQAKPNNRSHNKNVFQFLEQLYSPLGLIFTLLLIAILATRSAGGIGSLFFVITLFCIHLVYTNTSKPKLFWVFFVVIFIVLLIILNSDYSTFMNEFQSLQFTFERRVSLSQASLKMSLDNWLFGVGGGAFYSSFSQYRDLSVGNSFYHFAHNDYLQFWAEYGLIGVTILIGMIVQCIRLNLNVLRHSRNIYRRTFAYASVYSTIMLGLHSIVDFPLQIPAYTVLYLVILFFNVMTYREKDR